MATKKTKWTDEENERLKALVAKDVSIIKVAAELGRTTRSIRAHAHKLGTPFPPMKDYRKKFQGAPDNSWRRY